MPLTRDQREALLYINKLNDQFANMRNHLRWDSAPTYDGETPLTNPCITLVPTNNNVTMNLALTWGGDRVTNFDYIPSYFTCLDAVEKHLKSTIRYY